MEKKEELTNITSLFRNLGSREPSPESEDHTVVVTNSDKPKFNLRQATTPSIHLPSPQQIPNPSLEETPPTTMRPEPKGRQYGRASDDATQPAGRSSYVLLRQFAQGGCGEVWEGSQVVFPRVVALKKIRPDLLSAYTHDEEMKQQVYRSFLQEALTTAVLEHPNIVPVYDFHMDQTGEPLLSMRLIRGRRWDHLIYEDRNLPRAQYLERHLPILVSVGHAVAYAHSKGVLHRDLKPSQVMIGEFGEVYLMHWGLALVVDEDLFFQDFPDLRAEAVAPVRGGNPPLGGTPAYMAPEQAEMDPWKLGYFTDVFLLGATFYYVLTGTPPRRSTQQELDASGLLALPIEAPNVIRPEWDIPNELADICMKALERNPLARHATAKSFVEEIQSWVSGASKRRESETLTRNAMDLLQQPRPDYATLLECQSNLIRAIGLWSQNRDAQRLLETATQAFAEMALAKDDLNLARLMASRVRSLEVRDELLNEITANERLAKLAEAEAEEAEVHIRELQASGDMIQQQVLNLELRLSAHQSAMIHLLQSLSLTTEAMNQLKPATLKDFSARLMSLHAGLLPKDGSAARLFQRVAAACDAAGLRQEALELNSRAERLV